MKKFISIVLTFVIILSALPIVSTSAITTTESKTGAANDTAIAALGYEEGTYPPEEMPTMPVIDGEGRCGETVYFKWSFETYTLDIWGNGDMWDNCNFDEYGCFMDSLVISDGVNSIGVNSFTDFKIKTVTISSSLRYIKQGAFKDCNNLTDVYYQGTQSQWNAISIADDNACFINARIHFIEEPSEASTEALEPVCKLNYNELSDGTLEVCGFTNNTGAVDLVIPSEYNGKAVTKIAESVFMGNHDIVSVTIPETITYIGSNAFGNCDNLQAINFNAVKCTFMGTEYYRNEENGWYISGERAFYNCNAIKTLNIGDKVRQIPDNAFCDFNIEEILIPESVTSIGKNAFSNCDRLKDIYFFAEDCEYYESDRYQYTSHSARVEKSFFYDCDSVKSVFIGENVTKLPPFIFNSLGIESITLPENIENISQGAFNDCTRLKVINFNAAKCEQMGYYSTYHDDLTVTPVFDNCTAVEAINFGANVEIIPHFAFWGISQIEEIAIPQKVTKIGGLVFGSAQIGTMHFGASDCNETGISWEEVSSGVEGGRYEYFGRKPFYSIENLIITSTVNQIPDNMFNGLNMSTLVINADITSIGSFDNCLEIKELYLPDSIKEIKENAFIGCTNLETIRFPEHLDSIGNGAFDNTAWFDSQPSGCVYIKNVLYKYKGSEQQKDIVIKEGTTEIVGNAFFEAESIQSVSLPDTLVSIGDGAFSGCSEIKEIIIPNNVTLLGKSAFIGCSKLTKVTLSRKLKAIDDSSFRNCTNLESITIPDSVERIGHYAFTNCAALRSISFGKGLKYIGFNCFEQCTQLAKVDIPNIEVWFNISFVYSIRPVWETIHSYSSNPLYNGSKLYVNGILLNELTVNKADSIRPYLFCNYKDLKKVIINCAIDSIGEYAFHNCTGLQEVKIHKNVPSIGSHAFWNCPKLKDIYIYNPTCQITNNYETISGSAVIHGYDGSTAQLYAGNYNRTFMLIEDEPTVLGDVDGDGVVSIFDVTCIQRHLAEIPVYAYNETAADTDGDGKVTIFDATDIQRYLAEFPCFTGIGNPIS